MNWLEDFEDWIWSLGAQLNPQMRLLQVLSLSFGLISLFLGSVQSASASDGILRFGVVELKQPRFSPKLREAPQRTSQRLLAAHTIRLDPNIDDRIENRIENGSGSRFSHRSSPNSAIQEISKLRSQLQWSQTQPTNPLNHAAASDRAHSTSTSSISAEALFAGGADSLVARTVGKAEGTRRVDGGRNQAYYGHVDPGNRKWNLGSFSYQHEASSPEDADARQLRRLAHQDATILQKANAQDVELGLQERLNAIDLANQAPLAALDRGGYIERLKEARDRGFQGSEAILEARVNAYRHPDTQQWDAPGLGNNETSIRHDQARRMDAIAQVLEYDQTWTRKKGQFQANSPDNRLAMQVDESWQRSVGNGGIRN
ncbi:MAG: hypothetical protein VKJ24_12995 [Synechococcales bacterium]|nr:hypothetical protein [Synechococcales bacterium]